MPKPRTTTDNWSYLALGTGMFGLIRNELLLVGLVVAILSAFGTTSAQAPGVQAPAAAKPERARVEAAPISFRVSSNSLSGQAHEQSAATQGRAPRFVGERQRITVPSSSPLRSQLMIATVAAKETQRTLELPGVVEADPARMVKVLPPVAGRVVDLKVQLGDRVAQQQELAVIHVGGLVRTRSNSPDGHPVLAPADDRISEPTGNGTAAAPAQLRALTAQLTGMQEAHLVSIKAPVAGSVIDLRTASGAYLKDLSDPMMTIANLGTILVATNIPKKDAALISTGQPVQVRFPAYPGEDFKGETRQIRTAFDAVGTKAQIALQNPKVRLKPNMFAYTTFFGRKETVPVVPSSALVPTYKGDLVFVEAEPWVFEARDIGIGLLEGSQVVVAFGLKVGDRVVVRGSVLLLESQAQ